MEKETGKEPFNSPPALLAVYKSHDFGPYLDSNLNDVPVNFLDTDDTTGGNSGSPVLNGKGELIGLCFDGNYEGLSADYKYDERVARTINVDSRYILFTLDKVMGAKELIGEMT
ncbi:MAG: S46 family peptidase, partial [candidate division Zixibacteria bacterium]|nr:S46 family peptidase [candidate division Zixibacteria bacterium]